MNVVLSRLFIALSMCLLISVTSCSAQAEPTAVSTSTPIPATTEPTTAPTDTAVPTLTPTPNQPPPTSEPTPAPTVEASIVEETAVDPPLLIASSLGIFAAAADGSHITQLGDNSIAIGNKVYGYQSAFSPDGRFLAYSSPAGEPTTLNLLNVSSGETRLITPLLSEETQVRPEDDCLGFDNDSNRCQSAFTVGDVVWSPDGEKLAFISAHAGSSSDVYLYTVADQQIAQLSSGPTAVSHLFWSPDSQSIFYHGIHFYSGSGGEAILVGWAVRADGSQTIKLHDELASQQETIVGWIDAETIVIYSLNWDFCGTDLRTHNVRTEETTYLLDTNLSRYGVALQPNGNMLIAAPCFTISDWSIYFRKPDGETVIVLDTRVESPTALHWSDELNAFYAVYEDGWQLVSTDGQLTTYVDLGVVRPETVHPSAVSGAQQWAWADPEGKGVWVQTNTPDSKPVKIFTERANRLMWNPAGDTLFFVSGSNPQVLYAAHAPQFTVTAVTTDELGGSFENVLTTWSQPTQE